MYRNKKITAACLGALMITTLSGCTLTDKLFSDAGSGKQQQVEREDYLNTAVLDQDNKAHTGNQYDTYTLEMGTFEETARKQTLKRCFINAPTVRLGISGVTARFGEYLVSYGQYVDKGDVIATVYTDVDTIAIKEAEIKLNRLQERYEKAKDQVQEDLENILKEKSLNYDDYERAIYDISYKQRQQDWEWEQYHYESDIQEAQKAYDKLTEIGSVYEIKATTSGYVMMDKKYAAGEKLKETDSICQLLDNRVIYASGTQQPADFSYGMQVQVATPQGMVPATVVNGGSKILYGNLDHEETLLRLDLAEGEENQAITGYNNLSVEATIKTVDNVVLVPKKMVSVEDNRYFVTLQKEDGGLLKTQFLPGGSNADEYWVLDGLTAGMVIVSAQ